MEVILANHTVQPITEIYKAYKLCYSKYKAEDIKIPYKDDMPDIDKMSEFIVPLMNDGHTSPLEHVSFTFYISGISRACANQLVRHRTGKFNQQSQRYVDGKNFDFVMPHTVAENTIAIGGKTAAEVYADTMKSIVESYELLQRMGIPNEDARYVLPNSTTTNITVTFDLHNLRNFYGLRACVSAQWEVRELAQTMMKLVMEVIPFANIGARRCGKLCNKCFRMEE